MKTATLEAPTNKHSKSKVKHLSKDQQIEHIIKELIKCTHHYVKIQDGINAIGGNDTFINCIADFEWIIYKISGFVNDKIHPDLIDDDHIRETLNSLLWNTGIECEAAYRTYSQIESGYKKKGQLPERTVTINTLSSTLHCFITVERIYKALKTIVLTANSDSEIYSFSGTPAAKLIIDIIDLLYPDHIQTLQGKEATLEAILELPHLVTETKIQYTSPQSIMIVDSFINSLKN